MTQGFLLAERLDQLAQVLSRQISSIREVHCAFQARMARWKLVFVAFLKRAWVGAGLAPAKSLIGLI